MALSLFCVFFIATVLLSYTGLVLFNNKRASRGIDASNKAGLPVTLAVILGWILLLIATPASAFPFNVFVFGFYPFLLATFGLALFAIRKGKIDRFWIYFLLAFVSMAFFPSDMLVFQGFLPVFFDRFTAAVLWALFMNAYVSMDKVAGLTLIQTEALCLSFSLFAPLLAGQGNLAPFSADFGFYPFLIIAALIGFTIFKKKNPDVILGKTGATPLAYLMGLFFVLLAIKGYWVAALVMPAYYYFELIYSAIYRLVHRKNPEPVLFTFFITGVIRKNLNSNGIIPFLFLMMILLGMTGVLFGNSYFVIFLMTLGILVYLIYRLLVWGQPKITYRSMFADTKQASIDLGRSVASSVQEAKQLFNRKK